MIHKGDARRAALRLVFVTLAVLGAVGLLGLILCLAGAIASYLGGILVFVLPILAGVWVLFALFTFYFFRDPNPNTPDGPGLVVSPAHGKIDAIEQLSESQFPGGPCRRISMFLSVINIHVQNAPVSGRVLSVSHTPGRFLSALNADSAIHNENVLIGIESSQTPGEKIGVRLIAGVLARRIVPFVRPADDLQRGARISLIQFGSRCDLYLPLNYNLKIKLGDKVVGGETVIAAKS